MYAWPPELRCCARSRWRRCDMDTEVQEGRTSRHASLLLPFVQAAMIRGKPLIVSFDATVCQALLDPPRLRSGGRGAPCTGGVLCLPTRSSPVIPLLLSPTR